MQRSKRKRTGVSRTKVIVILFSILFFIIILGSYTYSKFSNFDKNFSKTQVDYSSNLRDSSKKDLIESTKPISVLLLGIDERDNDKGRSDTMIVMTINPQEKKGHLLSIPRDSYVPIAGTNTLDKINHAYAKGGIETSAKTVEQLLTIPIDFVVSLNMEGLVSVIDIVDGVTVNNLFAFEANGIQFAKGNISLSGTEALSYIRMRKNDSEGDLGRQQRQQEVIQALAKKLPSFDTLKSLDSLMAILGHNVQTNVKLDELYTMSKAYPLQKIQFNENSFKKGTNEKIEGIYYYKLNLDEVDTITAELRDNLQLDKGAK